MDTVDAHGKDVIPPVIEFEQTELHAAWRIRFADDQVTAGGTPPTIHGAIRAIVAVMEVANSICLYHLILRDGELEGTDRRSVMGWVALMFKDRNMQ